MDINETKSIQITKNDFNFNCWDSFVAPQAPGQRSQKKQCNETHEELKSNLKEEKKTEERQ